MFVAQVYVVALILAFARFASVFAAASSCSRRYTIKKGDFCDKISQEQHVSTHQLAATNPELINRGCTNLKVGQTICLGIVGKDCPTVHVVKADETCENIASANGLDIAIMRINNPQIAHTCDIYVGEVICTSKTIHVSVPPVRASGASRLSSAVSKFAKSSTSFSPPDVTPSPPSSTSTSESSTSYTSLRITTISFPSAVDSVSTGALANNVIEATQIKRPKPQPTEVDLPVCEEL